MERLSGTRTSQPCRRPPVPQLPQGLCAARLALLKSVPMEIAARMRFQGVPISSSSTRAPLSWRVQAIYFPFASAAQAFQKYLSLQKRAGPLFLSSAHAWVCVLFTFMLFVRRPQSDGRLQLLSVGIQVLLSYKPFDCTRQYMSSSHVAV